jgi:rhamnose transport system ATP-binding protein
VRGEVDRAELIRLMVGRELSSVFPKRAVAIGETVLELRNVSSRDAAISNVSLCVRRGEILGLGGLVGSGRTQLAETIFGITPADSGEILLNGVPVKVSSPGDAVKLRIGYVPEDRRRNGVILDMPISANTTLANLRAVSRHGFLAQKMEADLTRGFLGRLRIKVAGPGVDAGSLSGGNQQKVALARWLAINPEVLILDEPTQGIDVGSKSEIHSQIVDLAEQGLAIIMISSEMPELLGMSDRIAVMHKGAICGVLSREEATQQSVLALALGHPVTPQPDTF